jgi:two-component system response regulator DesR
MEDDLDVVAQAGDADEAIAMAMHKRPDVALVDIELPGRDGIGLTSELTAAAQPCRVLIVTTYARPGYLQRALDAGASGFLLKDTPVRTLAEAIRSIHAGERVVDHQLAIDAVASGGSSLSPRELEILARLQVHRSITELAGSLHLTEGTVRNHLSSAIRKLGVRTRFEALELATSRGWL